MGKWKLRLSRCALVMLVLVVASGVVSFFVSSSARWGSGALWEVELSHGQLAVFRTEFFAFRIPSPPGPLVWASSPTPRFDSLSFQFQRVYSWKGVQLLYLLLPIEKAGRAWEISGRATSAPHGGGGVFISLFYPAVALALLSIPAIKRMRFGKQKKLPPAFEVESRM